MQKVVLNNGIEMRSLLSPDLNLFYEDKSFLCRLIV
jgi:hypothetical protein